MSLARHDRCLHFYEMVQGAAKALFTSGSAGEPLAHIHRQGWWKAVYRFQSYLFSSFPSLGIP